LSIGFALVLVMVLILHHPTGACCIVERLGGGTLLRATFIVCQPVTILMIVRFKLFAELTKVLHRKFIWAVFSLGGFVSPSPASALAQY
jgi:hypothetical protein